MQSLLFSLFSCVGMGCMRQILLLVIIYCRIYQTYDDLFRKNRLFLLKEFEVVQFVLCPL